MATVRKARKRAPSKPPRQSDRASVGRGASPAPPQPADLRRDVKRSKASPATTPAATLPPAFEAWFAAKGWTPRPHQLALLEAAANRRSTLLIAPTGAGKTLAGFLPSLVALSSADRTKAGAGLRTLYISPLKALATDVARNLTAPITEMGLKIRTDTRSGDTSADRRQRQRLKPPDILLTTPEQVALLLSHADAGHLFGDLDTIILDELHALAGSKRGDLLALDLARLRALRPELMTIGLSATVQNPSELRAYLVAQTAPDIQTDLADLVAISGGASPDIAILEAESGVPWSGHTARYALNEIYQSLKAHTLTLIFVNTRMQAELLFHELWRINDDTLRIALHHGSLDLAQRKRVEAAMAAGALQAVVATSTLDLGIDWGDVDLVIHVGAPKGSSRLLQRIGRANHRLDEPSKALLVPSNRFEVLECRAALDAAKAGAQDAAMSRSGALDVLAQHVLGMACHAPFNADDLYAEVRTALPYSALTRRQFDRIVDFVATGGYALKSYDRFAKLRPTDDGRMRVSHPDVVRQYRLNLGTIVETPVLKVRLVSGRKRLGTSASLQGGRVLGEIDEYFAEQLKPGDTFVFAGEILRFEGLRDTEVYVARSSAKDPMVPSYGGGRFPMSTYLAAKVRRMLSEPESWHALPAPVCEWLAWQQRRSQLPGADDVLIETFPRAGKHFLVAYPFEGRLAHQTLGMLLTRRLERAGAQPLGFVATDYAISIWCRLDIQAFIATGRIDLERLFEEDMLGDDLDAWLAESSLMKRTFRLAAVIAGLIERRHPGKLKSGRQVTMSTDLIYDVLRRHDPDHILLEAAWADAATGLLDIARLGEFLARIKGRIRHQALTRVSPLAVPVLLEIGREHVGGYGDAMLREASAALIEEAADDT
ncbi:MAG: ligase-associated DNA damage response DEXH box helicase [Hyphomicrobium sp.]